MAGAPHFAQTVLVAIVTAVGGVGMEMLARTLPGIQTTPFPTVHARLSFRLLLEVHIAILTTTVSWDTGSHGPLCRALLVPSPVQAQIRNAIRI